MRLVGEKTTWLDVAKLTVNSKPVFIIYKFYFLFVGYLIYGTTEAN